MCSDKRANSEHSGVKKKHGPRSLLSQFILHPHACFVFASHFHTSARIPVLFCHRCWFYVDTSRLWQIRYKETCASDRVTFQSPGSRLLTQWDHVFRVRARVSLPHQSSTVTGWLVLSAALPQVLLHSIVRTSDFSSQYLILPHLFIFSLCWNSRTRPDINIFISPPFEGIFIHD